MRESKVAIENPPFIDDVHWLSHPNFLNMSSTVYLSWCSHQNFHDFPWFWRISQWTPTLDLSLDWGPQAGSAARKLLRERLKRSCARCHQSHSIVLDPSRPCPWLNRPPAFLDMVLHHVLLLFLPSNHEAIFPKLRLFRWQLGIGEWQ